MQPPITLFHFTASPTTEFYTLSLHDALPICVSLVPEITLIENRPHATVTVPVTNPDVTRTVGMIIPDRKSTRLNSSHVALSYAVFCLKKKKDWEPEIWMICLKQICEVQCETK